MKSFKRLGLLMGLGLLLFVMGCDEIAIEENRAWELVSAKEQCTTPVYSECIDGYEIVVMPKGIYREDFDGDGTYDVSLYKNAYVEFRADNTMQWYEEYIINDQDDYLKNMGYEPGLRLAGEPDDIRLEGNVVYKLDSEGNDVWAFIIEGENMTGYPLNETEREFIFKNIDPSIFDNITE